MSKLTFYSRAILFIMISAAWHISFAQAPNKISYQAVVRNASNTLISNATVGMRISILQGSSSGSAVYVETHAPTSNANGLVTIEIGNGTVVSGNFSTINWSTNSYFIKSEIDPAGGSTYSVTATKQMLSVPYALDAKTAATASNVTGVVAIANGGTGATTVGGARTNLGLGTLATLNSVGSSEITDGSIVNADISASAAIADTKLATISTAGKVSNSATSAASANTVNAIVSRDASGNFSAGTITASLFGNATSSTNASNTAITDDVITNGTMYPTWVTSNTGNMPQKVSSTKLTFNPSTGTLTAPFFSGSFSGSVASAWNINGNTGLADSNSLGTIDSIPLNFKIKNLRAGRIDFKGNTLLGYLSGRDLNTTLAESNTGIGSEALKSNSDGNNNTAVGKGSMSSNTNGFNNSALGYNSLQSNISGNGNVAAGFRAMEKSATVSGTTAIGYYALRNNLYGGGNTAIGYLSMDSTGIFSGTGGFNTAVGSNTMTVNTQGAGNVALGSTVLQKNKTGNYNTGVGQGALNANIDGDRNSSVGQVALNRNKFGSDNLAIGAFSLYEGDSLSDNSSVGNYSMQMLLRGKGNSTLGYSAFSNSKVGDYNIAIGYNALDSTTVGSYNIALGYQSMLNASGASLSNNVAIGNRSLYRSVNTSGNIAIGNSALYNTTSGSGNTAVAYNGLYSNTTGSNNTSMGDLSSFSNTTGSLNTAIGSAALFDNTTGNNNAAVGSGSLSNNTGGSNNTAVGYLSLSSNLSGNANVAIGERALASTTGDRNTALGDSSGRTITTGSNNITIGYNVVPSAATVSNEVTIGNSSNNSYRIYASGWTNVSDARMKHDIREIPVGLNFIRSLRPVEFTYNNADHGERTLGFIAQDVKASVEKAGLKNSSLVLPIEDGLLGLKTTDLVPVLTKAMQEQQEQIDELKKQNETLQQQVQMLMNRLDGKISSNK